MLEKRAVINQIHADIHCCSQEAPKETFTPSTKGIRFFRIKRFLLIFDKFFLKTKGFLLNVYEIF